MKARLKKQKDMVIKFKAFKKEVKKYWKGEIDNYPEKPSQK